MHVPTIRLTKYTSSLSIVFLLMLLAGGFWLATPRSEAAVELISFTASTSSNGVVLRWETGVEFDTAGFRLKRTNSTDEFITVLLGGEEVSFIPGDASGLGSLYEVRDTAVTNGQTYIYTLVEIDNSNVSEEVGTAVVIHGSAQQPTLTPSPTITPSPTATSASGGNISATNTPVPTSASGTLATPTTSTPTPVSTSSASNNNSGGTSNNASNNNNNNSNNSTSGSTGTGNTSPSTEPTRRPVGTPTSTANSDSSANTATETGSGNTAVATIPPSNPSGVGIAQAQETGQEESGYPVAPTTNEDSTNTGTADENNPPSSVGDGNNANETLTYPEGETSPPVSENVDGATTGYTENNSETPNVSPIGSNSPNETSTNNSSASETNTPTNNNNSFILWGGFLAALAVFVAGVIGATFLFIRRR